MESKDHNSSKTKEWALIEQLLSRSIDEQRRARRWGVFFKSLMFLYLFGILIMLNPGQLGSSGNKGGEHTALVDVYGVIGALELANADALVTGLRKAFKAKQAKGIILRINSPGGSPVQSDMVFDEVQRLRELHPEKKIYAVITDIGASGGYYIAASADQIYASESSIVGSVGVISASFGFVKAMDSLGIERRLMTSGKSKSMLDPFLEQKEEDVEHFETMLLDVHDQFIESVKLGRGDRLVADSEEVGLFSGRIWTGKQALALGLVDGIGTPGSVAREIIGYEKVVDYTIKPDPVDAVFQRFGVMLAGVFNTITSNLQLR